MQYAYAYTWALEGFQWHAIKSAFTHFDERLKINIEEVKPRLATLHASSNVM